MLPLGGRGDFAIFGVCNISKPLTSHHRMAGNSAEADIPIWQMTLGLPQISGLEKPAPHSTELLLHLHPISPTQYPVCPPASALTSQGSNTHQVLSPLFWGQGRAWPGRELVWLSPYTHNMPAVSGFSPRCRQLAAWSSAWDHGKSFADRTWV